MMSKNIRYLIAYMVLLVATLAPIWLTSMPQIGEYANHLARAYILLNVSNSPILQQFYVPQWSLIPNLAMDLLVLGLATLMSLETAGKVFVTLTLLLLSSGTIALHAALHKRLSPWPLVVFLILYNMMFLLGSLSFLFGLGMALWTLAAWIFLRSHPTWLRTLIFCLLTVALYFAHLSALGIYLLAVLVYEFSLDREQRAGVFHILPSAWVPTLVQLVMPALLFLLSPTAGGYKQLAYTHLYNKVLAPFFLVLNYNLLLDGVTFILLAEVIFLGLKFKTLAIHKAMHWVLVAVAASYLAMPSQFFSSELADSRIFVGFAVLFIASTDMRLHTSAGVKILMFALVCTFAVRMAFINYHWQVANYQQDEYIRAFDKLPQGARLLMLTNSGKGKNWYDFITMANFPCWAIIKKSAFVPELYAFPTAQPITFTPPYRELVMQKQYGDYLSQNGLPVPDLSKYDYVLIERVHPASTSFSQLSLRVVEIGNNFRLFKVAS